MLKVTASLAKKVPITGLEYSSQQFSCGLEMELTGEQTQDSIRQNIRKLYALLHTAIDEEIQEATANPPVFMNTLQNVASSVKGAENNRWGGRAYGEERQNRWSKPGGGARFSNQQGGRATQAQVKAIFAIAKSNGMERRDIVEMLEDRFNISQPDQLSVRQASKVIENLKESDVRE